MTSEETELTFVRCPSCRSLVPAVATRCRMCGYSFEASAEADDSGDASAQARSRVRQRTISASREQLDELASGGEGPTDTPANDPVSMFQSAITGNSPLVSDSSLRSDGPSPFESRSLFPPAEVEEANPLMSADPFASSSPMDDDMPEVSSPPKNDSTSSVLESFSAAIRPGVGKGPEVEPRSSGNASSAPDAFEFRESRPASVLSVPVDATSQVNDQELDSDEFDSSDDLDIVSDVDDDENREFGAEGEQTPGKRKRRRRRRRRGGSERIELREGEYESASVEAIPVEAEPAPKVSVEVRPVIEAAPKVEASVEEVQQPKEKVVMNGMPQRHEPKAQAPLRVGEDGVLVGWFVSFSGNPKGDAQELRSGKFFIGRQRLREHDMVVDRDGISTPHCLIAAGSDGSLRVQDLMSESGTFIKRADSDRFERISEGEEIEHGDKLRVGSYEVTICLLPSD